MKQKPPLDMEQYQNGPYPYVVEDALDSAKFLFRDMVKIAKGEIAARDAQKFARESVRAALLITCNAPQMVIK